MNFETFLLEGRGINNELKEYIDEINCNFIKDFNIIKLDIQNNNYLNYNLELDNDIIQVKYLQKVFNYNLNFANKKLKINKIIFNCDIYVGKNLEKVDVKKNRFSIEETNFEENEELILNPVIYLTIFIDENIFNAREWRNNGFMSSILHELHHVFQYWLLVSKDQDYPLSMIKAVNIGRWYNSKDENIKIYDLYYRLYLSRPHEITARTTQLYQILKNCENFSLESLIDTVKMSNEWKLSFYIESFNKEEFLKDLYARYDKKEITKLITELFSVINKTDFITELDITYTVLDEIVINKWLKQCEKYFKSLGPKIREKLIKIAKERDIDNKKLILYECNWKSFKILQ